MRFVEGHVYTHDPLWGWGVVRTEHDDAVLFRGEDVRPRLPGLTDITGRRVLVEFYEDGRLASVELLQ